MRIEQPDKAISGTFTTTTTLSERAHQFADHLEIRVEEAVPLADYPRIKCNVSRTGQRIYHLPFDQQYDTTIIEPKKGELWVSYGRRGRAARLPSSVEVEGRGNYRVVGSSPRRRAHHERAESLLMETRMQRRQVHAADSHAQLSACARAQQRPVLDAAARTRFA